MTSRKVDIAHVFNSAGLSALTEQHYLDIIEEQQKEIDRLEGLLGAAKRKLQVGDIIRR